MELQIIQSKIFEIRGYRVMLDFDLAELYQVELYPDKESILLEFPLNFSLFETLRIMI